MKLATAGQDQAVRLYRVGTWEELACLRGHEMTITAIDWSPDDRRLVSSGRDHQVLIWDVGSGQFANEPLERRQVIGGDAVALVVDLDLPPVVARDIGPRTSRGRPRASNESRILAAIRRQPFRFRQGNFPSS